jgi:hypothetical protein
MNEGWRWRLLRGGTGVLSWRLIVIRTVVGFREEVGRVRLEFRADGHGQAASESPQATVDAESKVGEALGGTGTAPQLEVVVGSSSGGLVMVVNDRAVLGGLSGGLGSGVGSGVGEAELVGHGVGDRDAVNGPAMDNWRWADRIWWR